MKTDDLNSILKTVKNLLDRADDPRLQSEDERVLFRRKAEQLMEKFRLEESQLIAEGNSSLEPVLRTLTVARMGFEYLEWLNTLSIRVANYVGAKSTNKWESVESDENKWHLTCKMVGYDSDLRYAELLWQSIRLAFISHIEPEYNPSLSEEENIYRLRSSGIPRKDVAVKIWGNWTHANSAKVGRVYKQECARRGEKPALDGRGINNKTFRDVYVRDFVYRIWDRLDAAKDATMATRALPILADREERVAEAFYGFFPNLRPRPASEVGEEPSEAGKKARKRVAKPLHETKAYQRKQERMWDSPAARAAGAAAHAAADSVNLSRFAPSTGRLPNTDGDDNGNTPMELG